MLGQYQKNVVSTVDFLDRRDILSQIVDVTNEELNLVSWLEQVGQYSITDQPVYHNFVNSELFKVEEVDAVISSTPATAGATNAIAAVLRLKSSPSQAFSRAGDLILFPNKMVGYVKSIGENNNLRTITVESVDGQVLIPDVATFANAKLATFSNAAGEGSKAPDSRRFGLTKEMNKVQIFKESFKITDIQKVSGVEVEFNGKPYIFYKGQHESLVSFRAQIAYSLLVGRVSDTNFADQSPALVDTDGNPIQTTKGMDQYVSEKGVTLNANAAGYDINDQKSLTRQLDERRAPGDYWMLGGTEQEIQFTDFLRNINSNLATKLNTAELTLAMDKQVDFDYEAYRIHNRIYRKLRMPMLNERNVLNFTGSAGYQKNVYLVPNGSVNVYGGGQLPYIQLRYMAADGLDMRYKEWMLGGLAPVPTDSRSVLEVVYQASMGLHMLGSNFFAKINLT